MVYLIMKPQLVINQKIRRLVEVNEQIRRIYADPKTRLLRRRHKYLAENGEQLFKERQILKAELLLLGKTWEDDVDE